NDPATATGTIMAAATLIPGSNTFDGIADLSLFETTGQGTFMATYTGIIANFQPPPPSGPGTVPGPAQAGGGTVSWGNFGPVSGHFTITPGAGAVPEPASLGVWAMTALAGAVWLRRRR